MSAPWIAVDLDGTLAYSSSRGRIGKPVPAMLERVKQAIEDGAEIRVFTVRAGTAQGKDAVREWLKTQGLEKLDITDRKDAEMVELWDDRARRVVRNKGEFCPGCAVQKFADANDGAVQLTDC